MSRPKLEKEELWEEWEKSADECIKEKLIPAFLREITIAGLYVAYELGKIGFSEDKLENIAYTFGGECFGQSDPWVVARKLLAFYKSEN